MTTYNFTSIDVPSAAGTYTYICVTGVDAAGEAVGSYGYTDGDDDSYFHGFVAGHVEDEHIEIAVFLFQHGVDVAAVIAGRERGLGPFFGFGKVHWFLLVGGPTVIAGGWGMGVLVGLNKCRQLAWKLTY